MFRRNRPSAGVALPAACLAILAGGVAWGAIPDSGGVIHACYHVTNKGEVDGESKLRVVDGQACAKNERALDFNQRGPQGAPGEPGPQGVPGAPGPAGPDHTVAAGRFRPNGTPMWSYGGLRLGRLGSDETTRYYLVNWPAARYSDKLSVLVTPLLTAHGPTATASVLDPDDPDLGDLDNRYKPVIRVTVSEPGAPFPPLQVEVHDFADVAVE